MNMKLGIVLLFFCSGLWGMNHDQVSDNEKFNRDVASLTYRLKDLFETSPRLDSKCIAVNFDGSLQQNMKRVLTQAMKTCDKGHKGYLNVDNKHPMYTLLCCGDNEEKIDWRHPELPELRFYSETTCGLVAYNVSQDDRQSAEQHVSKIDEIHRSYCVANSYAHFILTLDTSEKSQCVVGKLLEKNLVYKADDVRKTLSNLCNPNPKDQDDDKVIPKKIDNKDSDIYNKQPIITDNIKNFVRNLFNPTMIAGSCVALIMFLLYFKVVEIKINGF